MSPGRSDDLRRAYRIAGAVHSDHDDVKKEFLVQWTDIPTWNFVPQAPAPTTPPIDLPKDLKLSFLTKDMGPALRNRWPWASTMLRRGIDAYDWVLKEKPDAVIVWNDSYPEHRGACMAANELGIPTIEIVHGQTHPFRHGHFENRAFSKWKLGTTSYKDWHDFYRLDSQVVCTGSAIHDQYARANIPALRAAARHELDIPEEASVITFLTDVGFNRTAWGDTVLPVGIFTEFAKSFVHLRTIVPNLHLVVKLHPYEKAKPDHYQRVLHSVGIKDNYVVMDSPLLVALSAADLTTGVRTSAFADSLMLGVPPVVLAYEPFFEEHLFRGFGFEIVRRTKDVIPVFSELMLDPRRMDALIDGCWEGAWKFAGANDGQATYRTCRAIDRIIRGEEIDAACEIPSHAERMALNGL